MAVIYLTHPIHGAKVAVLDIEAEVDEQNGWKRYNPNTPSDDEEVAPVAAPAPVARRGRRKMTEQSAEPEVVNEGE